MKKFIQKVQDLGQKAAQLKQAIEAAPAQAAHLRDSVLMTAGQLQQMRQDVQSTVTGLRADSDDRVVQALREINDSSRTFLDAGYLLTGVDMDLSPVQRLVVHLEKVETVPEENLRSLLSANSGRQTVYAILASLAKADGISQKVHLSHLNYRKINVHVGPTPAVRLCWRADVEHEEVVEHAVVASTAPLSAATPPPIPAFAQSSYFEPRSPASTPRPPTAATSEPAPAPAVASSPPPLAASTGSGHPAPAPTGGDWKRSALDRFKQMPEGSKYRRSSGY